MINNFDKIIDILDFTEGDFYYIMIYKRSKDIIGLKSHQKTRIIKTYTIQSKEEYLFIKDDIIKICQALNARCGISTNRYNFKKLGFRIINRMIDSIENNIYNYKYLFDKVVGKDISIITQKRILIDLDEKDQSKLLLLNEFIETKTLYNNSKIYLTVETNNGYHLLCSKINTKEFEIFIKEYDINAQIHKNNFLALYYP